MCVWGTVEMPGRKSHQHRQGCPVRPHLRGVGAKGRRPWSSTGPLQRATGTCRAFPPCRLAVRGPVRAPAPLHKRGLCGCHPRLLEDRFFLVQALPLSRGHDNTAALPPHQHPPLPDCLQLYNYQKFLYFGANYLVAYIT